jgi:hypothetical protein
VLIELTTQRVSLLLTGPFKGPVMLPQKEVNLPTMLSVHKVVALLVESLESNELLRVLLLLVLSIGCSFKVITQHVLRLHGWPYYTVPSPHIFPQLVQFHSLPFAHVRRMGIVL